MQHQERMSSNSAGVMQKRPTAYRSLERSVLSLSDTGCLGLGSPANGLAVVGEALSAPGTVALAVGAGPVGASVYGSGVPVEGGCVGGEALVAD